MTVTHSLTIGPYSVEGIPCDGERDCGNPVATKIKFTCGKGFPVNLCVRCEELLIIGLWANIKARGGNGHDGNHSGPDAATRQD